MPVRLSQAVLRCCLAGGGASEHAQLRLRTRAADQGVMVVVAHVVAADVERSPVCAALDAPDLSVVDACFELVVQRDLRRVGRCSCHTGKAVPIHCSWNKRRSANVLEPKRLR